METIKKAIITDLTNGKTLTVMDGLTLYRTIDLRKYISTLRAEGNLISDRWVKSNGKKFKQYFIGKNYQFKCFLK